MNIVFSVGQRIYAKAAAKSRERCNHQKLKPLQPVIFLEMIEGASFCKGSLRSTYEDQPYKYVRD